MTRVDTDTENRIRRAVLALRTEAGVAGDEAQVAICDRALAGDEAARVECQRVIEDAIARWSTRQQQWTSHDLPKRSRFQGSTPGASARRKLR